jgi:acyl-CoA synthetase (AMP-forming)/AMP-acid ligase II
MNTTPSTRRTFADVWQRAVDEHGDRAFLTFRSEQGQIDTWTYREFDAVVEGAAELLSAHGVTAGDAVHLCLRNSPAFIAIWLATARLGAWMVPVDPASSSRDITTQLARVSPKIGFYAAQRAAPYLAGVGRAALCGPSLWRRPPRTSNRVGGWSLHLRCATPTPRAPLRCPSTRTLVSP